MKNFEKIFVNGVYVIAVNLDRSTINDAYAFREIVEEEFKSGHTKLVFDLSRCNTIDSTFFGVIIMALGKVNDIGEKLKVVEPTNAKESIFKLTNTLELFDLYKTREEAIRSFESDS